MLADLVTSAVLLSENVAITWSEAEAPIAESTTCGGFTVISVGALAGSTCKVTGGDAVKVFVESTPTAVIS
jgi:hypothetical protein